VPSARAHCPAMIPQALTTAHHRLVPVTLAVVAGSLALFAAAEFVAIFDGAQRRGEVAWDFALYRRIAEHWLATGQVYFPHQLAGPYEAAGEVNLYPPVALVLFIPFLILPAPLWWAIPMTVISYELIRWRPTRWVWPVLALTACTPAVSAALVYGNSSLWAVALLCLGFRAPFAWALLAFKPVEAVIGFVLAIRTRPDAYARGIAVVAGLSALFFMAWPEYPRVIANLGQSPLFGIASWPWLLLPSIAYVARTRDKRTPLGEIERAIRPYHRRSATRHPARPTEGAA
jgi:hypothetical protein